MSAHHELGLALKNNGDIESAIEAFQSAIKLKPNNAPSYYELGLCYLALGDRDSVSKEYEILNQLNPSLAERLQAAANK